MTRENPFQKIYDNTDCHMQVFEAFPKILDIELTNHCNLNCSMCARREMTRNKGFMSREMFENIIMQSHFESPGIRLIGWGEPFLHPEIIDLCKFAKIFQKITDIETIEAQSLPLHITTNGQLITERHMKELVRLGLDSIIFSFQGATKEGYEKMRVGASWDKIYDNILKLVKIRGNGDKPFIHVSSTMTDEAKEDIFQFTQFWSKIVDSVGVGVTQPFNVGPAGLSSYRPCTEIFHKLSIKWDGRVSACCADCNNDLIVGNLHNESLKTIWDGKILDATRTLLLKGKFRNLTLCKNCTGAYENFT